MNPASFLFAGYPLRDCLRAIPMPYIEVHMTNIEKRGFHSVLAETAVGMIAGFGIRSYILGMEAMLVHLAAQEPTARKPTPKTAEVKSEEGPSLRDQGTFSRAEQELMSDLQARRASLEERSQELDNRESLLSAAEKRIDDKLAELKKLQAAQTSAAAQVAEGGSPADKSLQSLVKVYETMKPKDAARIFDKLDMPVLISVVKQMKHVHKALGHGVFNMTMKIGNMPDTAVRRGMELFRDRVHPHVRDL